MGNNMYHLDSTLQGSPVEVVPCRDLSVTWGPYGGLCERKPDWSGFNTRPGSASLRPAKHPGETQGVFPAHLEMEPLLFHRAAEPLGSFSVPLTRTRLCFYSLAGGKKHFEPDPLFGFSLSLFFFSHPAKLSFHPRRPLWFCLLRAIIFLPNVCGSDFICLHTSSLCVGKMRTLCTSAQRGSSASPHTENHNG